MAKLDAKLVEKVRERIDRERLVKLVVDLTNIPSPTGSEAEMARAYHQVQKDAGLRSTLQPIGDGRYNALGVLEGAGGGKSLMFNGHLDTSFGPELAERGIGFRTQGQVVDDEWIYGMGSFNMKSALAAYIVATEAIQAAGVRLGGDVVIAGVAGEIEKAPVGRHDERAYQGYGVGTKFLISHGGVADACILGEPTNMKVVPAHCGSTWVKIEIPGVLVHTAWSDPAKNAISRSMSIVEALHAWIPGYQERHATESFVPQVNIAAIEGGWPWRGSRTPDTCAIYVDVRTAPGVLPIEVLREVRALVASVKAKKKDLEATVDLYVSAPGTAIPEDHALVRAIVDAHTTELGKAPDMAVENWYSDAAHLNRYGIPAVNYGSAGRIRTGGAGWSAQQGEHVHIGDLVDITKIYARVIMSVCGVA